MSQNNVKVNVDIIRFGKVIKSVCVALQNTSHNSTRIIKRT